MKIEIGKERPAGYQEIYPEVFDIFGFMLLAHSPFNYEKNEYNKTMTATLKLQRET